jgi:hypothetical protein
MAAAIVAGSAALIGDWLDAQAQVTQQTLYDAEQGAFALFRASTTARNVGDLFPHQRPRLRVRERDLLFPRRGFLPEPRCGDYHAP